MGRGIGRPHGRRGSHRSLALLVLASLLQIALFSPYQGTLGWDDPTLEGRFVDAFRFDPSGRGFAVSLTSQELDTVLVLVSPGKDIQVKSSYRKGSRRDPGTLEMRVRSPEAGSWLVMVASVAPGAEGGYRLSIRDEYESHLPFDVEPNPDRHHLERFLRSWQEVPDETASMPPPPPPAPPAPSTTPLPPIVGGTPPTPDPMATGWGLLVGGETQEQGFGLYSYLLCRASTDAVATARCESAIEALVVLPEIAALLEAQQGRKDNLNITAIPVLEDLPDASAERLHDAYDYAVAELLLNGVPEARGAGPFLLSSPSPVIPGSEPTGGYALQDLSWVPPSFVARWVVKFRDDIASPRSWSVSALDDFMIRMRTGLEVLAQGSAEVNLAMNDLGLTDLKEAFGSWIQGPAAASGSMPAAGSGGG